MKGTILHVLHLLSIAWDFFYCSEYIAGESNDKFWEFVDGVSALAPDQVQSGGCSPRTRSNLWKRTSLYTFSVHYGIYWFDFFLLTDTAQSNYHLIQKYAGKVLSPLHVRLMRFSLSLRSFSPAIENFQQVGCRLYLLVYRYSIFIANETNTDQTDKFFFCVFFFIESLNSRCTSGCTFFINQYYLKL